MNAFDIRHAMNDFLSHGGVIEVASLEDLWIVEIFFEGEEMVRSGHRRVIGVLVLENGLDV
jgi:hypothetical protein